MVILDGLKIMNCLTLLEDVMLLKANEDIDCS
jgi:hypothetical protein